MNEEDFVLFHQAEHLANDGQKYTAYQHFCALRNRGNQDIELLFWIVETTPNIVESRQVLNEIKSREPYHPMLARAVAHHARHLRQIEEHLAPGPMLLCPYCGARTAAIIKSKISTAGWIWFAAFFLLCLCCLFALVPTNQTSAMGTTAVFCLLIGAIGFAFRKCSYSCGHCGIALGNRDV